ncbi:MAG: endonuclease/exonuclease/phosphatase family protein [Rikenellaceae bacterium]
MGDSSYNHYGGVKKRRSFIGIILSVIMTLVSIVAFLSLSLTLVAPYFPPTTWWLFSVLGLLAPIIYVVNLAIALLLIIRWRLILATPIIILLVIGGFKVSRFANMDSQNHYAPSNHRGAIKVMTYNVRQLINEDRERSTTQLMEFVDSIAPDILSLQELPASRFNSQLSSRLSGYYRVNKTDLGLYSRFRIIDHGPEVEKGVRQKYFWADLLIGEDTVRLFNCHLQTTTIKAEDSRYITSIGFIGDTLREKRLYDMISRFSSSSAQRVRQVDELSEMIAESPYMTLVCGDFNDTPMSYAYEKISRNLNDAFCEQGSGYSHTFRGFFNMLRIDYILASEGISFESYFVDCDVTLSDHLPVISHIKIEKKP